MDFFLTWQIIERIYIIKSQGREERRRRTRMGFARSMQRNRGQRYKITNSVSWECKKNAHIYIYIYLFIRVDYTHSYISKYIYTRTHVHTQRSVVETYDTDRRNLTRTHRGRVEKFGICRYVSFTFVYVPKLVYSRVAGRPREEARRDISPEREISRRSRSRVVINATQLLLANHYVRKRDASEITIPRGPPWELRSFKISTSSPRECWLN